MNTMKRLFLLGSMSRWLVALALGLGVAISSFAQVIPVVTIVATKPTGTWSGGPGVFTVSRTGNPAPSLLVWYAISGTASNGVDYQSIGNLVEIPSGVSASDIVIEPLNHGQTSIGTVILTLTNSPLMGPVGSMPVNYTIGSPSSATVSMLPGVATNIPPLVRIVVPTNGATCYQPAPIPIVACARDLDGFVTSVEFFANNVSLGVVSNPVSILPVASAALPPVFPIPMPPYQPFVLVWSNALAGDNVLTAKATDNGGASTVSDPVTITVNPGPPPPPPTNCPPVVRITSPPDGAIFRAPIDLPISAYAADPDGFVTTVAFFAGTNCLGLGQHLNPTPPDGAGSVTSLLLSNLFVLVWSNAPAGTWPLTAVATDNGGASTVSAAVNIEILQPMPPPTNRPSVVTIVATDPIAIEGTNCWPWVGLIGATPSWSNWTANSCVRQVFTRCGPKNAIFTVRRFGDTNGDLIVTYDIAGTATNGLDYASLPGVVTIPAGQRDVLLTVVPLDDGPPDISSTVILKLKPSGSAPADYVLGYPSSAAAIILDPPIVRPGAGVLPDKCFQLNATGPDGAWFHVEYTIDLLHWTPICTNQVVNGSITFVDPDASGAQSRFYRVVPEANPPQ
jgi:hypothetical protein